MPAAENSARPMVRMDKTAVSTAKINAAMMMLETYSLRLCSLHTWRESLPAKCAAISKEDRHGK